MSRYGERHKDDLFDAVYYGMSNALDADVTIEKILEIVLDAVRYWILEHMRQS